LETEAPSIAAINAWAPLLEVLPLLMEKTLLSVFLKQQKMCVQCKMQVALLFTADDQVNPIPFMTMLLKTAKLLDNMFNLKFNDPLCYPIENIDDITKITNIDKYVIDLHTIVIKKQFAFFILLEFNSSLHSIKLNMMMKVLTDSIHTHIHKPPQQTCIQTPPQTWQPHHHSCTSLTATPFTPSYLYPLPPHFS
jgi:hypothetical protein